MARRGCSRGGDLRRGRRSGCGPHRQRAAAGGSGQRRCRAARAGRAKRSGSLGRVRCRWPWCPRHRIPPAARFGTTSSGAAARIERSVAGARRIGRLAARRPAGRAPGAGGRTGPCHGGRNASGVSGGPGGRPGRGRWPAAPPCRRRLRCLPPSHRGRREPGRPVAGRRPTGWRMVDPGRSRRGRRCPGGRPSRARGRPCGGNPGRAPGACRPSARCRLRDRGRQPRGGHLRMEHRHRRRARGRRAARPLAADRGARGLRHDPGLRGGLRDLPIGGPSGGHGRRRAARAGDGSSRAGPDGTGPGRLRNAPCGPIDDRRCRIPLVGRGDGRPAGMGEPARRLDREHGRRTGPTLARREPGHLAGCPGGDPSRRARDLRPPFAGRAAGQPGRRPPDPAGDGRRRGRARQRGRRARRRAGHRRHAARAAGVVAAPRDGGDRPSRRLGAVRGSCDPARPCPGRRRCGGGAGPGRPGRGPAAARVGVEAQSQQRSEDGAQSDHGPGRRRCAAGGAAGRAVPIADPRVAHRPSAAGGGGRRGHPLDARLGRCPGTPGPDRDARRGPGRCDPGGEPPGRATAGRRRARPRSAPPGPRRPGATLGPQDRPGGPHPPPRGPRRRAGPGPRAVPNWACIRARHGRSRAGLGRVERVARSWSAAGRAGRGRTPPAG